MIKNWIDSIKKWFKEAALRDIVLASAGVVAFLFGFKFLAGTALGLFAEVKFGILKYFKFDSEEEVESED